MKKERSYKEYSYKELGEQYRNLSKRCDELTELLVPFKHSTNLEVSKVIKEMRERRNTVEQQKNDIRDLLIEIDRENSKPSYHSLYLFSGSNSKRFNSKADGSLKMPSDSIAFRPS